MTMNKEITQIVLTEYATNPKYADQRFYFTTEEWEQVKAGTLAVAWNQDGSVAEYFTLNSPYKVELVKTTVLEETA